MQDANLLIQILQSQFCNLFIDLLEALVYENSIVQQHPPTT